jgi:hypothetical protein
LNNRIFIIVLREFGFQRGVATFVIFAAENFFLTIFRFISQFEHFLETKNPLFADLNIVLTRDLKHSPGTVFWAEPDKCF